MRVGNKKRVRMEDMRVFLQSTTTSSLRKENSGNIDHSGSPLFFVLQSGDFSCTFCKFMQDRLIVPLKDVACRSTRVLYVMNGPTGQNASTWPDQGTA